MKNDHIVHAYFKAPTLRERHYRYLIEGQEYTLAEVVERLPNVPYKRLSSRLQDHHEHTWADLSRSVDEGRSAGSTAGAMTKIARKKRNGIYRQLQREAMACKRAAAKAGHKEL